MEKIILGENNKMSNRILQALVAGVCAGISGSVIAATVIAADDAVLGEMVVSGEKTAVDRNIPAVSEGITAKEMAETVNVINVEDAVKYLRPANSQRYIGDRNSIVASRSSGTLVSARSLVYADGLLLSNLLAIVLTSLRAGAWCRRRK